MHKIEVCPEFGECLDLNCPYKSECACHYSAGDFRMEDGFTPQIFFDDEQETFHCATFSDLPYAPMDDNGFDYSLYPASYDSLDRGFVRIQKPE